MRARAAPARSTAGGRCRASRRRRPVATSEEPAPGGHLVLEPVEVHIGPRHHQPVAGRLAHEHGGRVTRATIGFEDASQARDVGPQREQRLLSVVAPEQLDESVPGDDWSRSSSRTATTARCFGVPRSSGSPPSVTMSPPSMWNRIGPQLTDGRSWLRSRRT